MHEISSDQVFSTTVGGRVFNVRFSARGNELQDFSLRGGRCKIFEREVPENGAEGTILENFSDF